MDYTNLIYISLFIILIVILLILAKYNTLIRLQNRVKNTKANIDIYLTKRFDLIPNLVECVKGYSKHENSTLTEIVSLRNTFNDSKNLGIKEADDLNNSLNKYLVLLENYPELKADTQYLSLQRELTQIENEIRNIRILYNNDVTRYNTAIETVPSNIVASMFAFKKADLLEISDKEKRKEVKVEL